MNSRGFKPLLSFPRKRESKEANFHRKGAKDAKFFIVFISPNPVPSVMTGCYEIGKRCSINL